jgi:hypothetical protein
MFFNSLTAPLHATPAGHVGRDLAEQAARDAMRLGSSPVSMESVSALRAVAGTAECGRPSCAR